jgi:hypothetical protein
MASSFHEIDRLLKMGNLPIFKTRLLVVHLTVKSKSVDNSLQTFNAGYDDPTQIDAKPIEAPDDDETNRPF